MTWAILTALFSHWWRNPLQLFALLVGLGLGTGLWTGVQAINAEARASYKASAARLDQGRFAQLTSDIGVIAQSTYIDLRRAGWVVSPVIEGRLGDVTLIGVDPLTSPRGIGVIADVRGADLGAFLTGVGQIFADAPTLARLPQTGAASVVASNLAPDTAMTDIGLAQRLLNRPDQIDRLLVADDQPLTRRPLSEIAPDLRLTDTAPSADAGRLTDSFHLNLTAFGLLSFVVGLFIVHGAIGLAFEQRRQMLRSLRALGAPLGRLIALMAAELAVLGVVAGGFGVALGYVIAAGLIGDVAATLRGLYGAEIAGTLTLRPSWIVSGLAIALIGTAVAAGGALWSMAHMPILASGQPRAWVMSRNQNGQMILSAVLLAIALAMAIWGQGLIAGFVMLGALLIGAALGLPPLLAAALRLGAGLARRPLAQWFWADSYQQLPGLSLALMALLLAMAANVGVSTMVSSFRLTFTGFLDQRLASELYISVTDAAQAQVMTAAVADKVRVILPIMSIDQPIAGLPATIYGARDDSTYRDNWQFLQSVGDVWDILARGDGVLINEQLFRRAGLELGAMVAISKDLSLPVLGIYGDYGNPVGQVILTQSLFERQFPNITALRFGLRIEADQVGPLRAMLRDELGLPEAAMIDQAAIKSLSLSVFERTFAVTAALNILTLTVAGFAMMMSLLTLAAMRLPQLAPVWALGVTRRRLALLELLRALVLAALTGVLALPLGLALAWALLAVVNVEAFGWRLPMFVFPMDYLRLGGLTLIAAGLAALWPAWRLSQMPPVTLLGVFRNER